jgi:hypothetical protein
VQREKERPGGASQRFIFLQQVKDQTNTQAITGNKDNCQTPINDENRTSETLKSSSEENATNYY